MLLWNLKNQSYCFVDEDVPGGAAAYMFNKVMEKQNDTLFRRSPKNDNW